jgi:DNA-binding response OmpR family regulator
MKGDEARMLEAGCDAYISKPLDTRKLADRVAGFLPGNRAPREET